MGPKYIEDRTAGSFLPISFIILMCTGPGAAPWLGLSMAIAAAALKGTAGKKAAFLWPAAGIFSCLGGELAGEIVMTGCAVLLWQSLEGEGRRRAKLWCLCFMAATAVFIIIGSFMARTGEIPKEAVPDLSVLFAIAALSDASPKRRFLSCLALGMGGSPLGFICLGAGLLFKEQDWAADTAWVLFGLTWLIFPLPELWLAAAAFALWCVPEMMSFFGYGTKYHCVPFLLAVFNPWALQMLGGMASKMLSGMPVTGISQVFAAAGLPCALLMLAGCVIFLRKGSGTACLISFLFGPWCPAGFLLGACTGMADITDGERTDAVSACRTMLVLSLALSLANSPLAAG